MTKYQTSIDGLQRILDEYPGTHHGFDYAFLSEEESKKIIQEARDTIVELQGQLITYHTLVGNRLGTTKLPKEQQEVLELMKQSTELQRRRYYEGIAEIKSRL